MDGGSKYVDTKIPQSREFRTWERPPWICILLAVALAGVEGILLKKIQKTQGLIAQGHIKESHPLWQWPLRKWLGRQNPFGLQTRLYTAYTCVQNLVLKGPPIGHTQPIDRQIHTPDSCIGQTPRDGINRCPVREFQNEKASCQWCEVPWPSNQFFKWIWKCFQWRVKVVSL